MKYLELFLAFLKVGIISFGGGYAAIPFIRELVLSHGWMSEDTVSYLIAVAESTPGPIMVNAATYAGSIYGGILGAIVSTVGVVLPAFVIIILICVVFKHIIENSIFQGVLNGIKPSVAGVIMATGVVMLVKNIFANGSIDIKAIIIATILSALIIVYNKIKSKKLSPIVTICVGAVLGAVLYSI